VTDQRDRVTTDPGIGPVDLDNTTTLRSIAAAAAVEVEPDGSALYYEPKPLVAYSDHKTLEIATVKLSAGIDPRKLPTELSLPRVQGSAQYDSGWPQAAIALTSSQPPQPARRAWRMPVALLAVLCALLIFALARSAARRSARQANAGAVSTHAAERAPAAELSRATATAETPALPPAPNPPLASLPAASSSASNAASMPAAPGAGVAASTPAELPSAGMAVSAPSMPSAGVAVSTPAASALSSALRAPLAGNPVVASPHGGSPTLAAPVKSKRAIY